MTEPTYTIKPLEWSSPKWFPELQSQSWEAKVPGGTYVVNDVTIKEQPSGDWLEEDIPHWHFRPDGQQFAGDANECESVEAAKAAAEQHYRELMRMGLVVVGEMSDG